MARLGWVWGLGVWLVAAGPVGALEARTVQDELDGTEEKLKDGSFYDSYEFEGKAGDAVAIALDSGAFDTYLLLEDAAGTRLAQEDDGEGSNARLVVRLPQDGRYRILATSYKPGDKGAYTLRWQPATAAEVAQYQQKTEADRLYNQGIQQVQVSKLREALQSWEAALQLYRAIKNRRWEASILDNLGDTYSSLRQYEKAIDFHQKSLAINREIGNRSGEAYSLSYLGSAYSSLRQYEKAIDFYQQSLAIRREIGDRSGEAYSLSYLGSAYSSLEQYEKAIDFYQQSLAIRREIGDRSGEAYSLDDLGNAYSFLRQYEKAIDFYQQSLAINREIANRSGEAYSLSKLNNAYRFLGQYEKMIDVLQQSLAIKREIGDRKGEAYYINRLGDAYGFLEQYEKAIDVLQQSLAINREIGDRSGEAYSLGYLGNTYGSLEQYQKAIDFYQQSLAINREISDRSGEATSLGNLGNTYSSLGQYQKAIDFHQQALVITREIGYRFAEASILGNLGVAYFSLGQYQKAIDFYQQSLAITRENGNRSGESNILSSLGSTYNALEDYPQAISFYEKALAIAREIGDRSKESSILSNLGGSYRLLNKKEDALNFYKSALSLSNELGDKNQESMILTAIGNLYASQRKYEEAIEIYQKSLSTQSQIEDSKNKADLLGYIGDTYFLLAEYRKAIDIYHQQLKFLENRDLKFKLNIFRRLAASYILIQEPKEAMIWLNNLINDAPFSTSNIQQEIISSIGRFDITPVVENIPYSVQTLQRETQEVDRIYAENFTRFKSSQNRYGQSMTLKQIGENYRNQGNLQGAIAFYKQYVNSTESIRQDIQNSGDKLPSAYSEDISITYRRLADLLFSQGRIAEAQQVLELLKVQEVRDYSRSTRTTGEKRYILLSPAEQEVVDKYSSVAELGRQLVDCTSQCTNLRDQLDRLTTEFHTALKNLSVLAEQRKNDPNFLDPNALSGTKALEIVNTQPNTMLVYLLVLEDKLRILYIGRGGVVGQRTVAVSQADLGRNIGTLRELLQSPSSNLNDLKTVSNRLYTWLIAPLESELKAANTQHLIFALDRVTRYLPLAVLWDGQQYLLQRYTSATILSADLTNTTAKMPAASQPNTILALGFSDAAPGFNPLTNVPAELDAIVRETSRPDRTGLYNGDSLLNREFTRTALRDRSNGRSLLHIATHAQFLPNDDPFLLLGNGDKFPVRDLETWNRYFADTHLVVLSACQTGFGGPNAEGIEIPGIYSYFLNNQAADTVLASLWKVDDRATTLLMQDFYRRLATPPILTKAQALRQTQLDFLAGKIATPQDLNNHTPAHPYYWSPFVLTGNSW